MHRTALLVFLFVFSGLGVTVFLGGQEKGAAEGVLRYVKLSPKALADEPRIQSWLQQQHFPENKSVVDFATVFINSGSLRKHANESFRPFEIDVKLFEHKYTCAFERGTARKSVDGYKVWTWTGRVKETSGSSATITYSEDELVNGVIRTPKAKYAIRPAPPWKSSKEPPLHIVLQLDDRGFSADGVVFPKEEKKNPDK